MPSGKRSFWTALLICITLAACGSPSQPPEEKPLYASSDRAACTDGANTIEETHNNPRNGQNFQIKGHINCLDDGYSVVIICGITSGFSPAPGDAVPFLAYLLDRKPLAPDKRTGQFSFQKNPLPNVSIPDGWILGAMVIMVPDGPPLDQMLNGPSAFTQMPAQIMILKVIGIPAD